MARQFNLTEEEKFSFPLGGSMAIDTDQESTEDFFELYKNAAGGGQSTVCEPLKLLGVKKTDSDLKGGNPAYGFKLAAQKTNYARVVGAKNIYDASRGSFDEDATFPYYKEKCCEVAQEYYSGFKEQGGHADPTVGLAYHYGNDEVSDNYYEQIFMGYDMSNTSNHPYEDSSPYAIDGLDKSYFQGSFDPDIFHNIYIKKLETKKTKITFPNVTKSYFEEMDLHSSHSTLIEVEEDKITFHAQNCPNNGKHDFTFRTCKSCVNELGADYFNTTSDSDTSTNSHERPAGTLEGPDHMSWIDHPDASNYGGDGAGSAVGYPPYDRQEEGGCQLCHDELVRQYQVINSASSDYEGSNLIGKT